MYFALFQGYIVTANADGSIPLNAKVVTQITDATPLVNVLLAQANMAEKLKGNDNANP